MLDEAGFPEPRIVLSSELDELAMWQIRAQISEEAPRYDVDAEAVLARLVYGVGTRLITSHGYSALDGVYKLVAIDTDEEWTPAIKISDTPEKMPIPGGKRVWRVYDSRGLATADVVSALDEDLTTVGETDLYHPHREGVVRRLTDIASAEELLVPAYDDGRRLEGSPDLDALRAWRTADLARLDPGVRRLVNPHVYHVSLTAKVKELQRGLVAQARAGNPSGE
jgi:nicotinate phosphoribosyltransferase